MNYELENSKSFEVVLEYLVNTKPLPSRVHKVLGLGKFEYNEILRLLEEKGFVKLEHGWAYEV